MSQPKNVVEYQTLTTITFSPTILKTPSTEDKPESVSVLKTESHSHYSNFVVVHHSTLSSVGNIPWNSETIPEELSNSLWSKTSKEEPPLLWTEPLFQTLNHQTDSE